MKDIKSIITGLFNKEVQIFLDDSKENLRVTGNTAALTAEDKNDISTNKDRLIALLKSSKNSSKFNFEVISSIPVSESYELSAGQRRLWTLSQFEGGSAVYNMPMHTTLKGSYDIDCFQKAITATIDRHEILRTIFKMEENGEVRQYVQPTVAVNFELSYVDFRNTVDTPASVSRYIREDSSVAFDLEKGPLFRVSLLQTDEETYVFYYNMHHIIGDGWSMNVLAKDVFAFYDSFVNNTAPALAPLAIQYKDYANWQAVQLETEKADIDKAYWLERLSGDLPVLDLPSEGMRPAVKTHNGHHLKSYISKENTEDIKRFTEEKRGSIFISLLATLNVLLHKYTSNTNIIIGSPVAGRDHADLTDQIGFYVNTLALHNVVNPQESFAAFYNQIKEDTLTSFEHQMYPFDRLIEDLNSKRDISRNAIFDAMLTVQNSEASLADGVISIDDFDTIRDLGATMAKFDLQFTFTEAADHISFDIIYNSDVYETEMIKRLMTHYKQLLNVVFTNPNEEIKKIQYLTQEEQHQLLYDFNATNVLYPGDKTVVQLFQEQVAQRANATAVVFEDQKLTYQELDVLSNQFAHFLQSEYHIQAADMVGLELDRNEWFLVSMFGILKLGAVYVPINPEFASEKISFIKEDANCKVSINDSILQTFRQTANRYETSYEVENLQPDSAVYVMYTSGSTGVPKGVVIEQKSIVRLVKNTNYIDISENDRILGLSNFSFDGATFDIYMPLLNGGTLVIAAKDIFLDLDKFDALIESEKIDSFFLTTAFFNTLVDSKLNSLKKLKCILFGGEQVSVKHVAKFKELYPEVNLHHVYGPTENTTFSTYYEIKEVRKNQRTIPIGAPIANSTAYILDNHNALVPIGVSGEICVGGDGLAKEYLNQGVLTEEKFIAHPFIPGKLIYKTGDIGKWLPDGNIEFIGRKDNQVKIRGHRIELGEVENALLKQSEIEDALVLALENKNGEKEIVAYVVTSENYNVVTLRKALKEIISDYMIPSYFIQLESFPLNSNGKVDKKALPAVNSSDFVQQEYVAPVTKVEELLVEIWQDLLKIERVGVTDVFFELGGHSLLAVRLLSAIKNALNVSVTVSDIFNNSTISALASFIESKDNTAALPLVTKQELPADIPLSYAQERLWFIDKLKGSEHYHMPVLLNLKGDLKIDFLSQALKTIVERHETLRTFFVEKEGVAYQAVQSSDRWELNIVSGILDSKKFIAEEINQPFDLSKDYMLRATIIKVSDEEHILVLVRHHIATDGWSESLIVKEFKELYASYASGREADLPALSFQYTDYSVWQRSELSGDVLAKKLDYWEAKLGDVAPSALPTDYLRPAVQSNRGDFIGLKLDSDRSEALRTYAKEQGVTLFMLLSSIYKVLLYRYSGQSDICIGTTVANRPQQELESMIGFFVNTLALRSDLSGNPSFNELLKSVKQTTLEAYDHIAVPFEKVVDRVEKTRDKSRSSLFQVLFVLNNNPGAKVAEFSDITIEPMAMNYDIAKYDLTIFAEDGPEGISFSFNYCTDLFSSSTVSGLRSHYENLLTAVLENGTSSIGDLTMLNTEEEQALVVDCNTPDYLLSGEGTVLSLFEAQAAKTPDAIAFVYNDSRMTYKELDEAATKLAYYYQQTYDLKENDLMGIMMDTSNWSLLGILSILKSGAGYVPIDLSLP
ncbi:non-ribosomal peptide synthetase, partial [Flavobacterium sp. UGB4466]|uniref:non-ribosomal peptide synthetase n=1 Tax=Flavobacterium sp. UGB4466 TaxID=2730889 RepID=UPI00192BA140